MCCSHVHTELNYFGYETPVVHSKESCENYFWNGWKLYSSIPFLGTLWSCGMSYMGKDEEIPTTLKVRLGIAAVPLVNTIVLIPADLFFTAVHHAEGFCCGERVNRDQEINSA